MEEFPNIYSLPTDDGSTCRQYHQWEVEQVLTINNYDSAVLTACHEAYPDVMQAVLLPDWCVSPNCVPAYSDSCESGYVFNSNANVCVMQSEKRCTYHGGTWNQETQTCEEAATQSTPTPPTQCPPGSTGVPPNCTPENTANNGPNYPNMLPPSPTQQQQCGLDGGIWNQNGQLCCFGGTVPQDNGCVPPQMGYGTPPPPSGPMCAVGFYWDPNVGACVQQAQQSAPNSPPPPPSGAQEAVPSGTSTPQ